MTFKEALAYFNNDKKALRNALGVSRQLIHHWSKIDKVPELRRYQIKEYLNDRQNIHAPSN